MEKNLKNNISANMLNEFSICKALTNRELSLLSENIIYKEYSRKNILYREDCYVDSVILLLEGVVKQVKCGTKGKEIVIRFVRKGEFMRFRSFITRELSCSNAEAMNRVKVGIIPRDCMTKLMQTNASFLYELLHQACYELEDSRRVIVNMTQKHIRERVATSLIYLLKVFGVDESNTLTTYITRKEIASVAGTVSESVTRTMSEFKNDKLIAINDRHITYLNIPKLSQIAYSTGYVV